MRAAHVAAILLTTILAVPAGQPAMAQAAQDTPQLKQIVLTAQRIESFVAAQNEIDAATATLPPGDPSKPDPKVQAQIEAIVKKNGFSGFPEFNEVYSNIGLVISGIDPKTKAFTEPQDLLAREIAAVEADKQMPAKDKQELLEELKAVQSSVAKVQYPENVALVTKHYDKLAPFFAQEEEADPPGAEKQKK